MEGMTTGQMSALFAGALALLLLRAVAAALEAALVAVGSPRAQALASAPGAGPRARALESLVLDAEATAFTVRTAATLSVLFAGALAAWAGGRAIPAAPMPGAVVFVVLAGLVSLPLAATGRGIGAAHGEAVALGLAVPFRALRAVLRPLMAAVRALAIRRARFSLPRPPLDEMERVLAEQASAGGGKSAETTTQLIHAVFEFRDKVARDVMVPRTDVVGVEVGTPVPEIIRILSEEGHSRMPVYQDSLDHIVGVLHARDLVPLLAHPEIIVLRDVLRPAHFVPWAKPVDHLLREMQRRKLHMAFVVDEFGGVMGICTLEDVLEQIVGEIEDEFEDEAAHAVEAHADGTYSVLGATAIADFNEASGAGVPDDEGFETVAGFLNSIAGAIPAKGDRFFWNDWVFTIAEADPRKVTKVRAARVKRA